MTTATQAIPTMYRGTQFRSRLEATWAAFFDILEWPWKYEPVDLKGYIPDFVLPFDWASLLIEVKPAVCFEELDQYTGTIERSGWTNDALIVGAGIMRADLVPDPYPIIGLLSQRDFYEDQRADWCWDAGLMHYCLKCNRVSIHHSSQSWNCYRCGAYEGNSLLGFLEGNSASIWWAHAQNQTQWRRPRVR
ncbi:MAG TPA: hypothetical protein VNA25_20695 [Phycisphaerae bacterium]|nr:hypothetical protein [Phycisphaerae bacterium]